MDHHHRVHAIESTALEHLYLTAGVTDFFGRRPDNSYRQPSVIRAPCERNARAGRGRGNNVVTAGMTDGG
jgi:hypothetical protein